MDGTVAVVTGGAQGIGRATALAFAARGARTVVADIAEQGGAESVRAIREAGGDATFVRTDVTRADEVDALFRRTLDTYGRLDHAFNNAGHEGVPAFTADCTDENWRDTLAVNLTGVWLCMRAEIRAMAGAGGGAIVNCSSVDGRRGYPGISAYVAAKHGVLGLTKSAALEYAAAGLRINAVLPGVIDTPMVARFTAGHPEIEQQLIASEPLGRMGTAEEVAAAVVWLCSPEASFVTGHALAVDGGLLATTS